MMPSPKYARAEPESLVIPEQGIPALTPEEMAMVRQAEHANNMSAAFVLHYIHWAKARAGMLDAMVKQGQQLALVSETGVSDD